VYPLECLGVLLQLVVAKCDVVLEVRLVAEGIEGVKVLLLGLLVKSLLVCDGGGGDNGLWVVGKASVKKGLAGGELEAKKRRGEGEGGGVSIG